MTYKVKNFDLGCVNQNQCKKKKRFTSFVIYFEKKVSKKNIDCIHIPM